MNKEPNVIYKTNVYLDKEGREVEELVPLNGGNSIYVMIMWMPMPSGPQSFTLLRSRIPIKDAKNIGDAFNKHDNAKKQLEEQIEKNSREPDLVVPSPQESKIILGS